MLVLWSEHPWQADSSPHSDLLYAILPLVLGREVARLLMSVSNMVRKQILSLGQDNNYMEDNCSTHVPFL